MNQFYLPTQIVAGEGSLALLGSHARSFGSRALVVCGKRFLRGSGHLNKIQQSLAESGVSYTIFDEVTPDPTAAIVERGIAAARTFQTDVVIGIGGGSAMDVAKAVASAANESLSIEELIDQGLSRKGLPCICIPTTSGTGSEVTGISVLTIPAAQRKTALRGVHNFPNVAIIDPVLTYSLPPQLTAITGVDALTHAIEAYLSARATAFSDAVAERAIQMIGNSLLTVFANPSDRQARSDMAMASCLAGIAISQAGTGGAHGIGMSLGGLFNVPHGMAVGSVLPHILRFNARCCQKKLSRIATLLGHASSDHTADGATAAIKIIVDLLEKLELPTSLAHLGLSPSDQERLLEDTLSQKAWATNPRTASRQDVQTLISELVRD
jgi:alcohol dehydrogenase class IV